MSILASRYGYTRPAAIAARLAALRTRFAPVAIELPIEAPAVQTAPVLVALPPITRAQVAQWQAERAEIRADLPMRRHYALAATFDGFGPDWSEIEAAESRLADLDDFLIFEDDSANAPELALPLAA